MPGIAYQAVVLAGGEEKSLHPLTTTCAKALLSVANKPLISYSLRLLIDSGLKSAIVVVIGEKPAAAVQAYINQAQELKELQCTVVSVPEDYGTADALRAVRARVTAPVMVVLSGDLVAEASLSALVAEHRLNGALATVTLARRRTSPSAETKPGRAPKNIDYVGTDTAQRLLLYYASSSDSAGGQGGHAGGLRDLRLPLASTVARHGAINLTTSLFDAHLYVLDSSVLSILEANPKLSSIRQDLLPFIINNPVAATVAAPPGADDDEDVDATDDGAATLDGPASQLADGEAAGGAAGGASDLFGVDFMGMSHSAWQTEPLFTGDIGKDEAVLRRAGTAAAAPAAGADSIPGGLASGAIERSGGAAGSGGLVSAGSGGSFVEDRSYSRASSVGVTDPSGVAASGSAKKVVGSGGDAGAKVVGSVSSASNGKGRAAPVSVFVNLVETDRAKGGRYCFRVDNVQAYGEVNRDCADFNCAFSLTGHKAPSAKYENYVHPTSVIGNKALVGSGCIVGEGCYLGDKSSVKRSVLGSGIRLGANVKVLNSVLMDGVSLGDGCHVQNCVLCAGASVRDGSTLKDCQVAAGFVVAGNTEFKGEVLVAANGQV